MESKVGDLAAIERVPVFRQVVDAITAYIDGNNLRPGDRLPGDREFVSALKVSRPLVQQALKVLEGLGRVSIVHGLGTFVADDSDRVLAQELVRHVSDPSVLSQQLLEARTLIDAEMIRSAYAHDRDGLIRELEHVVEQQGELQEEPDGARGDLHFEATFGRFCTNDVLRRLQTMLQQAYLQSRMDEQMKVTDYALVRHEHEQILDALKANDMEGALELYFQHIRNWI